MNGQSILTLSGVVIQEMVEAETSGVLFTVHPVTKDPSQMVINVSCGLGNALVSGEITPDEIVIDRTHDNQFSISSFRSGTSKKVRKNARGLCVSDEEIYKLCEIALESLLVSFEGRSLAGNKKLCEVSILGHTLDDLTLEEISDYHPKFSPLRRMLNAKRMFAILGAGPKILMDLRVLNASIKLTHERGGGSSARDVYETITKNTYLYREARCSNNTMHVPQNVEYKPLNGGSGSNFISNVIKRTLLCIKSTKKLVNHTTTNLDPPPSKYWPPPVKILAIPSKFWPPRQNFGHLVKILAIPSKFQHFQNSGSLLKLSRSTTKMSIELTGS
ncbi:hypothetical protein HELRODRAFT_165729 [Helobdella robusta]|uniref:Pyruvate phosphate dikinase AMP/ATP-binding domain-containing protein n=1 Tax=Helobdella robusta TaxID=6412 RepID=T1EX79_HELRO|nr:hypothetical protein HELRODRAFT_165729 [Helobdella robusta]ESN91673.1 hypothetical protein HELRODRAFT_165729 [Helobdella robusta]